MRAGVRVKATEVEREVHHFSVDDLLLCYGPSGSVRQIHLGIIFLKRLSKRLSRGKGKVSQQKVELRIPRLKFGVIRVQPDR